MFLQDKEINLLKEVKPLAAGAILAAIVFFCLFFEKQPRFETRRGVAEEEKKMEVMAKIVEIALIVNFVFVISFCLFDEMRKPKRGEKIEFVK